MKKIIFPLGDGIAVIHPTGALSVEATAKKDVPTGVAYRIVEDTDIPEDRTYREAWTADFTNPDGYGE